MNAALARPAAVALALLALAGAGCGTPAAQATPPPSGEENKSAEQVLADARAAMAQVRSYRVDSTTTFKDGSIKLTASFDDSGNLQGRVTTSGVTADVVVAGGQAYLKGRDFWARVYAGSGIPDAQLQVILGRIGDNYVHDPNDVLGLVSDSKQLIPADLPDCLGVHGQLSKGGHSTVDGQRVVVVLDDGAVPGGSPGRYLVADASPHRLLRAESKGAQTVGQPPASGRCPAGTPVTAADADPSRQVSFSFSEFNAIGPISKPSPAVEIAAQ